MIEAGHGLVKESIRINPVDMWFRSTVLALVIVSLGIAVFFAVTADNDRMASLRVAEVPKVDGEVRLDGQLSDPQWAVANWTDVFVYSDGRTPAPRDCKAKLVWSDEALFVGFQVLDSDLIAPHRKRDDPLYTKDVVELFLDPEGDTRNYFEFEVSPRGTLFDARFPRYRHNLKRSKRYTAHSFQAAVQVDGTLDDASEDRGYTVEMRIDFRDLGVKPAPGAIWRANLFRIDAHASFEDYTAWTAPLVGDFHALDRFGLLVFR